MSQSVKDGDTVKVHYRATSSEGVIFDSTSQKEPLQVTLGKNQIIPAFENALIGMTVGDKKSITIESTDAFGPYMQELITTVPKSQLPKDLKLKIGQYIQIQQPDGSVFIAKVLEDNDLDVTFDANHPLAGKDITFDIHLIGIS